MWVRCTKYAVEAKLCFCPWGEKKKRKENSNENSIVETLFTPKINVEEQM